MDGRNVIVIGSGFGGSVAALRLTEKGYRVTVLEAGRRFGPTDFAKTNWNLRRFLWAPRLGMRGIQRITLLKDVLVLSGAGVGGGSLVYANVLTRPHDAFFTDRQWKDITDWKDELGPHYARAEQMLGVAPAEPTTPADDVMRRVAAHFGVEETFAPTPVAVWRGEPGVEVPDPYFGGKGPTRTGCIDCGGCMVGCRHNAKNSVDKNYLHLAEEAGAAVYPDSEAVDLTRRADGRYEVTAQRPGAWLRKRRRTHTADHVVFAAGALGTTRLLLRLADAGRLAGASSSIGHTVRTNSESLVGATAPHSKVDHSHGVAITSSIHPSPDTQIEPVRYAKGSNAMGMLATILVDRGSRVPGAVRWVAQAFRHPVVFARSLSLRRWSERSVILLVMQSRDNSLQIIRKRGLLGTRLSTGPGHGEPNPRYLPVANEAARAAADAMGGHPGSSINEVLFGAPTTAHLLGGACIAADSTEGVIDPYHRMFGLPGLHVLDGAAVPANLGANPSLTITALAERATSLWPNWGDTDPRPGPGEGYRRIDPVAPRHPIA